MPSTSNKRAAPVTSPHFSPLSATPEKPSKKRKIADGSGTATGGTISDLKFYAVRAGKKPGVYDNWVDCQKQILNFKGEAKYKRFNTLEEAENFVAGLEEPSGKYYGVVVGSTAGVYTDWDEVSELLKGSKGPKYKGFKTEAEAQDFVRANILSLKAGATKTADVKVDAKAKVEAQRKVEAKATVEATGKRPPQKQTAASRTSPTIVYSDGSCLNNGKPNARAGVGVYFGAGDPRNIAERLKGKPQTNQRAELTAVLRTLQAIPETEPLLIRTDSQYSINCITKWSKNWETNGWRTSGKEVKNKDLVQAIRAIWDTRQRLGTYSQFEWVKGHSTDPGNDAADQLANQGSAMPEAKDDGVL